MEMLNVLKVILFRKVSSHSHSINNLRPKKEELVRTSTDTGSKLTSWKLEAYFSESMQASFPDIYVT